MRTSPGGLVSVCSVSPRSDNAFKATRSRSRFQALALVSAFAALAMNGAYAAPRTWGGGGPSVLWSSNANWSGSGVSNGDTLTFTGTAKLSNSNDTLTSIGSITFGSGAGAFVLGGNTATLAGNVTNSDDSIQTIDLGLNMSATRTFSASSGNLVMNGVLGQTAAAGLTKLGNFSLTLGNSNSYAGTTQVNAGTLLANNTSGSATGSGAVTVASGATLGGSGTIAPTGTNGISVSGVLAPGSGVGNVGTLTLDMSGGSGTAVMNSGASFAFELGLGGSDITSIGSSDMLSLTGAASGDFTFNGNNINLLGTGSNGFYKLFDTSLNNANTWGGLTFDGTTGVISSGLSISNLASGKTGTLLLGTGSNGGSVGDIYLSVVPEPSAALLAGLGSCFLFRRRRIPS